MPNRRDRFRLGVAETLRWSRPLAPQRCFLDIPSSISLLLSSPRDTQKSFQRRRPMIGLLPLCPKGPPSSPRPPPLPSVPRDQGEAPYKAQSRRGAQPSCHPGLAGLRRPKRGSRGLGTGRKHAPGRKAELPRVLGRNARPLQA